MNSVPFSRFLNEIEPFIFSTRVFVMYRPNPLPWTFRVRGLSIRANFSNIFSAYFVSIPVPWSRIKIVMLLYSSFVEMKTVVFSSEYLQAFSITFRKICCNLSISVAIGEIFFLKFVSNLWVEYFCLTNWMTFDSIGLTSVFLSISFSSYIFVTDSIFSTRWIKRFDCCSIISRNLFFEVSSSLSQDVSMVWANPLILVRGVLNSCETVDIKSSCLVILWL